MTDTKNIKLCKDGKYRWIYEMNLWTNPTIMILLLKIFFYIFLGLGVFLVLLELGRFSWHNVLEIFKTMGLVYLGFSVVVFMGYALFALIMGGKYIVLFEMDEKGISHTQQPKQVKKANAISALTLLAGAASGNITMMGIGLTTANKDSMYSEFDKVKSITPIKRNNVIKIDSPLCHNQVYAATEDFDMVLEYIQSHCDKVEEKEI